MQHSVRNSLIDSEQAYLLKENALCWSQVGADDGVQKHLPYTEIKSITLISYPAAGGSQYQCTIKTHSRCTLKIRSHHYQSLNNFKSRAESYAPFVRGLCLRVAAANGAAQFWAGSTIMWFVYLILVVLMAGVAVAGVVALWQGNSIAAGAVSAVFAMSLFAGSFWTLVRRGKGRPFAAEHPPESLLGE